MAKFHFGNICIDGIACAVPAQKITRDILYDSFMKKCRWLHQMIGVREMYRSIEEQTTSDLCFVAAVKPFGSKRDRTR